MKAALLSRVLKIETPAMRMEYYNLNRAFGEAPDAEAAAETVNMLIEEGYRVSKVAVANGAPVVEMIDVAALPVYSTVRVYSNGLWR